MTRMVMDRCWAMNEMLFLIFIIWLMLSILCVWLLWSGLRSATLGEIVLFRLLLQDYVLFHDLL